jgi:hypothetical protein
MRTLLICHGGAALHEDGIARWLAESSELAGIVVVEEPSRALWRRAKREIRRSGMLGFLDVLAFRAYYRTVHAGRDRAWLRRRLRDLQTTYPPVPSSVPVFHTASPNTDATSEFIATCRPDVSIALCKVILKPKVFTIPTNGTFVCHPGVCPEYRNAHGCFWALAQRDLGRVGMTLLRIDEGVDTGPVYQYFSYPYDEVAESHVRIQNRVLLDNLNPVMERLQEIHRGTAVALDTSGRHSAVWGQPRLTAYARWKRAARRDAHHRS